MKIEIHQQSAIGVRWRTFRNDFAASPRDLIVMKNVTIDVKNEAAFLAASAEGAGVGVERRFSACCAEGRCVEAGSTAPAKL